MTNRSISFSFGYQTDMERVEDAVLMALLAAEGLYGHPRVRLETGYHVDAADRSVTIAASSEVGRDAARIFAGFAARELGEDAFLVLDHGTNESFNQEGELRP